MKAKMMMLFLLSTMLMSTSWGHGISSDLDFLKEQKTIKATLKAFDYHLVMLDLRSKDIEVLGVDINQSLIDVYLSETEFKRLAWSGYKLSSVEKDNVLLAPDQDYKNPAEIEAFLRDIHGRFPEFTKLVSIGKSVEGRDIWALKLSDNPELNENEPTILFNSMHHAREVMTPEVGIDIISYILENFEANEQVRSWLENSQIWVVPMLNVDGNNKVWNGSSMWRKNTRGGHGVDINRNYPYKWGTCNGSSGSTWSDTYRGASAGSEPETQALMNFTRDIKPVFNISFHSYSEMVLYPFGCSGAKTGMHDLVSSIGQKMAKDIGYVHGTPWEILYSVDGGDVDWMYDQQGTIPYVIEVSSRSEGFQPSYSQWRNKTVERVRPAWQLLLERVRQSGVKGSVVDQSGQALEFTIKVFKENSTTPYNTFNRKGYFHLALLPGNYKLELTLKDGRGLQSTNVTIQNQVLDWSHQLKLGSDGLVSQN
jgi:carboxypeptidase T